MKLNPNLRLRLERYLSTPRLLGINIDLTDMLKIMRDTVIDCQKHTQENMLERGDGELLAKVDISNKRRLLIQPSMLSLSQRALSATISAIPNDYQEGRSHED
jgi:hypothetical protein